MSRDQILELIETEIHPVNMNRTDAVEFLEDLAGSIHRRIIELLREGDDRCKTR